MSPQPWVKSISGQTIPLKYLHNTINQIDQFHNYVVFACQKVNSTSPPVRKSWVLTWRNNTIKHFWIVHHDPYLLHSQKKKCVKCFCTIFRQLLEFLTGNLSEIFCPSTRLLVFYHMLMIFLQFQFQPLRKIPKFHLIFWCGNFEERYSFHIVSGESPETMRKMCLSSKFPHQ